MRTLSEGGVVSGVSVLSDPLGLFLVQAIIIIAISRLLSVFGSYLKQPLVIFEVIGGILLGEFLSNSLFCIFVQTASFLFLTFQGHPLLEETNIIWS